MASPLRPSTPSPTSFASDCSDTDHSPRLPDDLHDLHLKIFHQSKGLWIDLIFKTNEAMEFFIQSSSKPLTDRTFPLFQTRDSCRCCLRIVCLFHSLEHVFAPLFDIYPSLYRYLEQKIRETFPEVRS